MVRRAPSPDDPVHVAGVDACRTGWVVALCDVSTRRLSVFTTDDFSRVLALPQKPAVIGVDTPIGLLDAADPGGRACDQQARTLLGSPRCASVFSPPVRAAMAAPSYRDAHAANRVSSPANVGLPRQTFGILPKLKQVDDRMTPELQTRVFEVHPELSFFAMGGCPPKHGKKTASGRAARLALLRAAGYTDIPPRVAGAATDDVLDAVAVCWTAERIHRGTAARLPVAPGPVDARGLRMEIWR